VSWKPKPETEAEASEESPPVFLGGEKLRRKLREVIEYLARFRAEDGDYLIKPANYRKLRDKELLGMLLFISTTDSLFSCVVGHNNYRAIINRIVELMEAEGLVVVMPMPFWEEDEEEVVNRGGGVV